MGMEPRGTFPPLVNGTRSFRIFRIGPEKFPRWQIRRVHLPLQKTGARSIFAQSIAKESIVFYLAKRVFGRKHGTCSKRFAWRGSIMLSATRPNCDLRHVAWLLLRTLLAASRYGKAYANKRIRSISFYVRCDLPWILIYHESVTSSPIANENYGKAISLQSSILMLSIEFFECTDLRNDIKILLRICRKYTIWKFLIKIIYRYSSFCYSSQCYAFPLRRHKHT